MFESANLQELGSLTRSVITPQVVEEGKTWNLDDQLRRKIRLAMFGSRRPRADHSAVSVPEQRELLREFTKRVVEPIVASFPPHTAAWAVLMLYQEFVDAVFIQPLWESDVGGGG
jgi:hypothetical protein